MKILMANYPWIGGIAHYIQNAFTELDYNVTQVFYEENLPFYFRGFKLNQIKYIDRLFLEKQRNDYNKKIIDVANKIRPDIFLIFNEGYVNTETISIIKKKINCITVCLIGDDPFDSFRFKQLPYSLKFFDQIYNAERMWMDKIRMVSPGSKLFRILSAYDDSIFNLDSVDAIKNIKKSYLDCQIVFTGESYGQRAEGGYRSTILSHLSEYNLKLWGDDGWKYQFRFYPNLSKIYSGGRLSFDELLYVYSNTLINLNMPSPQLLTAFQPRVFEISACGGFQVVDFREDLFDVFKEDEIVTFKTIPELLDKVNYFINNPSKRISFIEAGLKAVKGNSWKDRAKQIIKNIRDEI